MILTNFFGNLDLYFNAVEVHYRINDNQRVICPAYYHFDVVEKKYESYAVAKNI